MTDSQMATATVFVCAAWVLASISMIIHVSDKRISRAMRLSVMTVAALVLVVAMTLVILL